MWFLIPLLLIIRVSSLDLPMISLLQRSPSSPITCHATRFSPKEAVLFWAKNGKELTEGVETGEIVSNHDGTFQISVKLNVTSVPRIQWGNYTCVFHFTESEEIVSVQLDKHEIMTELQPLTKKFPTGLVIGAIVGFLIIALVFAGVCKYKQSLSRSHMFPCSQDTTI